MPIHNADRVLDGTSKRRPPKPNDRWERETEVMFADVLPRRWQNRDPLPPEKKAFLDAHPYRVSAGDAWQCDRKVAWKLLKAPREPFSMDSIISMSTGTMMHEAFEKAIGDLDMGEWTIQAEVPLRHPDWPLVGFADFRAHHPDGHRIIVEVKTTKPFGYAMRLREGPSDSHVAQASIYGHIDDADEVRLVYLAQAPVTGRDASDVRTDTEIHGAEWKLDAYEFHTIAVDAIAALVNVIEKVDAGVLPAAKFHGRDVPDGHIVTDVKRGAWALYDDDDQIAQAGTRYDCRYCDYQPLCISHGPGEQPIPNFNDEEE